MSETEYPAISWHSRTDGLSICHDCRYLAPWGVFGPFCIAGKRGRVCPHVCDLYRRKHPTEKDTP